MSPVVADDKKAPSKYIMYLDAYNLYGWAMSQYLPTGQFKWTTEKDIEKIKLAKYEEDSDKVFMLEVDLQYPNELHDAKWLPNCCREIICDKRHAFNLLRKNIRHKYNKTTGQVNKPVPTLNVKEK